MSPDDDHYSSSRSSSQNGYAGNQAMNGEIKKLLVVYAAKADVKKLEFNLRRHNVVLNVR